MQKLHQLGLTVTLLAAGLTAQTASSSSVIPANPLITLHLDGPQALRAAFLPTNLGKMFAGPEFQEMVAPITQMLEAMKEQAGGELPFDINTVSDTVINYRGRLVIALHLLDDAIDFTSPNPPDFMLTVALTPDGATDLAGMCTGITDLAAGLGDQISEITSKGKKITVMSPDPTASIAMPFMHNGHAVMMISSNIEMAADKLLNDETPRHSTPSRLNKANMGVSIQAKQIITLLTEAAGETMDWAMMGKPILERSGLKSLETIDLTILTRGPALLQEVVFNFNQNDRGILGMVMPSGAKKTALTNLLPADAMTASAWPWDMQKLYSTVQSIFDDLGDDAPIPFDELLSEFETEFGVALKEGIFDTFGNGLMNVQIESEDDIDIMNPLSMVNGITFGMHMKDGKTLGKSIDTMLRSAGMHAGRTKDEHQGFLVYHLNVAGLADVHYAATPSLFIFGLGDAGGDVIRKVLGQLKAQEDGVEEAKLTETVRNRLKMVPGNWTGLSWTNVESQIYTLMNQLDMVSSELPPEFAPVLDVLDGMPKLLKAYNLREQVSVIRTEGNRWVLQWMW
jgi:hypothetical protein